MATGKMLCKSVGMFLIVGVFLCSNALGENKFEKEAESENVAVKLVREVVKGDYKTITAKELKELIAAKKGYPDH